MWALSPYLYEAFDTPFFSAAFCSSGVYSVRLSSEPVGVIAGRSVYFSRWVFSGENSIMAVTVGRVVGAKGNSNPLFRRKNGDLSHRRNVRAMASVTYGRLKEEYKLLSLKPNATENEVKKAYRRLALQYHPDVCKGDNCGVRFNKINEAYQTVMSTLAEANEEEEEYYADENYMGFDQWEDWMGFEGGLPSRDYSNHINYYV